MERLWATILSGIAMLGMYGLVVHYCERRQVTELALKPAARELGLGLLMGLWLYTTCMVVLRLTGNYRIQGVTDWHVLIRGMSIALLLPAPGSSRAQGAFSKKPRTSAVNSARLFARR